MKPYDYAVCGLGMSGSVLAAHMAARLSRSRRVLLLEPRREFQRDKSWCFWRTQRELMDDAISHSWHRWRVSFGNRVAVHASKTSPYVHVDSGLYYQQALAAISRREQFDVQLGATVSNLRPGRDGVLIESDSGTHLAKHVFDTRPVATPPGTLLQFFQGWEVQTEHAIFDTDTVTLMDFEPATVGDIHFYYVLPFAPDRALVETTHFARRVAQPAQLEAELQTYLSRLGAGAFEVKRREGGVIPMFRRPPPASSDSKGILRMGVCTATTKASSGYCYQNTQRQARLIVDDLQRGEAPRLRNRSAVAAWFDSVFVRFLEQSPNMAADAFMRLYESVEADAMIRFLSDEAEPRDYLAVAQALPMLPLGRQALAHVSGF